MSSVLRIVLRSSLIGNNSFRKRMWDVSKKTYIKTSAVSTPRQTGFPPYKTERTSIYATTTLKANHSFSTSSRATNPMILWFVREFACVGRSLRTRLVKPSIATIFGALLVFVTFPNAWGQSASTGSTPIVKMRTLQIDAWARPAIGQFVPADDVAQLGVWITGNSFSQPSSRSPQSSSRCAR